MRKIGIVGFGALGRLAAKHLKTMFEVQVADHSPAAASAARLAGVDITSLDEVCQNDAVILCVPPSAMGGILMEIAPKLASGTLVMDVCSIKTVPCGLMEKLLPLGVEVIGTHPLFGPQSASEGIEGLQVVLCPVRTTRLQEVKKALGAMGLQPLVMTAEEHDREMARTQAIAHFALKGMAGIIPEKPVARLASVGKIIEAIGMVKDDSPVLFSDIESLNPFAKAERKRLLEELGKIEEGLE